MEYLNAPQITATFWSSLLNACFSSALTCSAYEGFYSLAGLNVAVLRFRRLIHQFTAPGFFPVPGHGFLLLWRHGNEGHKFSAMTKRGTSGVVHRCRRNRALMTFNQMKLSATDIGSLLCLLD